MITMLRLDERLIHGQVATQWIKNLDIDSIIVVDDNSANSKMLRNALMMAVPNNMKTVIKTCDDALKIITDPRMADKKTFIVTGKIDYLKRITDATEDIKVLVVGNYGCINKEGAARERKAETLYVTEEEKEILEKITEHPYPCYYWCIPATEKIELIKCLKK